MPPRATRRQMLTGLAALLALPGAAEARPAQSRRVVGAVSDAFGTTLQLALDHAPFARGGAYQDPTVMVFVPRTARFGGDVPFVVHFHGHRTTAERAMTKHRLREQLAESKQDAVLVVPQCAVMAADSSVGALERPGSFAPLLREVLAVLSARAVADQLGAAAPRARAGVGRLYVSAHSGGYHGAACAVRDPSVHVNEVWLFDALYAEASVFRDWVVSGRGKPQRERHKLISYSTGGTTESQTSWLFAELDRAGVKCAEERVEGTLSRADITLAEAVSVRTARTHGDVTFEWNAMRDCLYASALPRHLRTSWFDAKTGARPIERRR